MKVMTVEQSSSKKRKRPLKKNKSNKQAIYNYNSFVIYGFMLCLTLSFYLFCRTTVSEEPDKGDKFKNTNNDEDKKQRIDRMWASFKEGTDTN